MVSKQYIRDKTGVFLQKSQGTSSFRLYPQDQYFTSGSSVTGDKNFMTGAISPILPMRIVTMGNGGAPIDFIMLINPESCNHAKTSSYQTTYTRSGWQIQLWGPNQDTISSTGKTAATMNPGTGLENFVQQTTFSYLNLLALLSAYRTNGYEFFDRLDSNYVTRVINRVSGVHLMYDNQDFVGHFQNFTLDEDDEHPYILNYNFEFVISSLMADETEIRGHYKKLPVSISDPDYVREEGGEELELISDVYTGVEPTVNLTPPRATDDRTTQRLWEQKTGLPWSEALEYKLTDGSVQGNLRLRQQLYSKTWDPNQHKFV
jgi:hypothetical protein